MNIFYAVYALELNAGSPLEKREGALLKVIVESGASGYADCHPWPNLGDLPVKEQLEELAQGRFTDLTRCSLFYAQLDAQARMKGQQLMKQCYVPSSHFLMNHISGLTFESIQKIIRRGFTHLKIKVGRDLAQEAELLTSPFLTNHLKVRLDFNERLTPASFRAFLQKIETLQERVDFIEDPFPYDAQEWTAIQREGWTLACDRQVERAAHDSASAKVLIIKPARCSQKDWKHWTKQRRIVTTYAGHPLEQMSAAYVASQIDPLGRDIHGLLSHHVYSPNSFSGQLNWEGPQFVSSKGMGFGFDEDLDRLNWVNLK